ncbi:MAG: DNA polymerase domain-containing protein [Candidatus Xenobium sp.]|jgi:DNA polymerase I|nr:DNA polymerase II [Burkholderiales bacterium]
MHKPLSLDGLSFAENPALFGGDRAPGLVAADERKKGGLTTWWREGERTSVREEPFQPFLWLADPVLLGGYPGEVEVIPLEGEGEYRHLVRVPSMSDLRALSRHIASSGGLSPAHPDSPQIFLADAVHQYLLGTGRTFFGGMAFGELRRMQIHLATEVPEGLEYSQLDRDPILALALADSAGNLELLSAGELGEKGMLEALLQRIEAFDPDVLEGHNLFKVVLPFLASRARHHKLRLTLGRGRAIPRSRQSRMQIAERTLDYPRWDLSGRELLDIWILAQMHDVSNRELESTELAEVARLLGVGGKDEPLSDWERSRLFRQDRSAAEQRLLDEVAELRRVADVLAYPYFLQSQIFPYSYQNVVLRGNATRINSLFLREYLRQGRALPPRPVVKPFAGGLTAQEHEGLAHEVLHCDVQSLYPSLMLTWKVRPQGDTLGIFLGMLEQLREFRLQARSLERQTQVPEERRFYGALQNTFKILINSFYGYLGFAQGNFADFEAAAEVTARGRELLTHMIDWLKEHGARILEVDTDGIYFVAPEGEGARSGEELVEALNSELPEGIQVDLDGRYRAMYVHRMKNYALLDLEGQVTLRGSGLRSRSLEPFLRQTLEEMLTLALQDRSAEIPALFDRVARDLRDRRVPVKNLARTETLSESPENYARKIEAGSRNRSAAYELALASGRDLRAGDTVSYYITGDKASVTAYDNCRRLTDHDPENPDENPAYYLRKLRDLYKKFAPGLGLPEWKPPS